MSGPGRVEICPPVAGAAHTVISFCPSSHCFGVNVARPCIHTASGDLSGVLKIHYTPRSYLNREYHLYLQNRSRSGFAYISPQNNPCNDRPSKLYSSRPRPVKLLVCTSLACLGGLGHPILHSLPRELLHSQPRSTAIRASPGLGWRSPIIRVHICDSLLVLGGSNPMTEPGFPSVLCPFAGALKIGNHFARSADNLPYIAW
jgi:hypothetical protein